MLLRVLRLGLVSLVAIVVSGGVLVGYFVYTPDPERPHLSGTLTRGSVGVGGLMRTYLIYLPRASAKDAPLLLVMHGSGENGARIRIETGYGFERLADEHHLAVVYPNAHNGDWNACSTLEVELVAVEGGGHGIPQPYRRHPRLLGPSPKEPNGPVVIWAFFERRKDDIQ